MASAHTVAMRYQLRPSDWHVRNLVAWVGPVAVLAIASTACLPGVPSAPVSADSTGGSARDTVQVRIGKAIKGDLTGELTFTGEVQAKGRISVIPRVIARLDRFYVEVGSRVRQGEPLAELDRADLEAQVLQAQAAQAAAEAKLAQLKSGARPEAVAQAQANLKAAQARVQSLEQMRKSGDQDAAQKRVDDARARLQRAESTAAPASSQAIQQADAALASARTRLNALLGDPVKNNDRAAVDAARQEVSNAEQRAAQARQTNATEVESARRDLQDAEQALALSRLSFNAFDLDQARALVEAADAQVKLVSAPASPDEIKAAEASAEQAFALAELARSRLRDATLSAPAAGVVAELNAAVGSTVGPTGPVVTLIPIELQVSVQAEESQLAQLQVGQAAALSVESFPQESFDGVVKSIAPVLDPRTRTVAARVEVADPRGKLRPGMFALVAVKTEQHKGVVLVPKDAILRVPQSNLVPIPQNVVIAVVDGRLKRTPVTLGAQDARNVEIVSGLAEGVDVVLTPSADLQDGEQIAGI